MKKIPLQSFLVLLFLAIVAATVYFVPALFGLMKDASYRFVITFLLLIAASNILARIAVKFINL